MSRIKREAFGNKHRYQSEISNYRFSEKSENGLKRRLKFWKWLFQEKWQRLRVFFSLSLFFLCYLQFDILKRFVADGASSLALLLVLLVLVYGSTVLRGYKHKEEKARETRQRGTETVWEVIIPSHIVTGCGSINYTPENDDTWPVLVLGELRDRESRGEPARVESGVTSGRHDCSWIIKSNRHYRFIYPLGRTHHSSFLLRPKSFLSFPFSFFFFFYF